MKILCSGSEGFIGQHVVNNLLTLEHEVVGIDHFDTQVHDRHHVIGHKNYEVIPLSAGALTLDRLWPFDTVIHLGAKVGVGQSMHQIVEYCKDNSYDTAHLLQNLTTHRPKRLIVASSMSIYGEGATEPKMVDVEAMNMFTPIPTPETKPPDLRSIYALTKYDQEQLCLIWGKAYDVPTVALRFFNVFGPGQSLNNPYTGVLAIFASRLLNDKPPVIYEDGQQTRDFIHVDDVANAVVHAATTDMPSGAYNVGTGVATSIRDVARRMISLLRPDTCPDSITVTGEHRKGDIRHCFADIGKIMQTGWCPQIPFAEGLMEYCAWLQTQPKPEDKFDQAHNELVTHGLTK